MVTLIFDKGSKTHERGAENGPSLAKFIRAIKNAYSLNLRKTYSLSSKHLKVIVLYIYNKSIYRSINRVLREYQGGNALLKNYEKYISFCQNREYSFINLCQFYTTI